MYACDVTSATTNTIKNLCEMVYGNSIYAVGMPGVIKSIIRDEVNI